LKFDEDPAFLAELQRREADYLSGKSPAIPWEDVLAQIYAQLATRSNEAVDR
jgi:putative addiction module component (TIGR02574 family)